MYITIYTLLYIYTYTLLYIHMYTYYIFTIFLTLHCEQASCLESGRRGAKKSTCPRFPRFPRWDATCGFPENLWNIHEL